MHPDRGDDEAHVLCVLAAEDDDAADELATAALIHQGDEAIAELHLDGVHRQEGVDVVNILVVVGGAGLGRRLHRRFCRRDGGGLLHLPLVGLTAHKPTGGGQTDAHDQQGQMGRAGDAAQQCDHKARREDRPRLTQELPDHVVVQAPVGDRPGDHHGGRRGDHQGGDLAHQAVTDGGDGVGIQRHAQLHAAHGDAQNQAAHEVDGGDDQG